MNSAAQQQARRDKARTEGKCIQCCKRLRVEGYSRCQRCIERHQLNSTDLSRAKREFIGYLFGRSKRWGERLLAALGRETP